MLVWLSEMPLLLLFDYHNKTDLTYKILIWTILIDIHFSKKLIVIYTYFTKTQHVNIPKHIYINLLDAFVLPV